MHVAYVYTLKENVHTHKQVQVHIQTHERAHTCIYTEAHIELIALVVLS